MLLHDKWYHVTLGKRLARSKENTTTIEEKELATCTFLRFDAGSGRGSFEDKS